MKLVGGEGRVCGPGLRRAHLTGPPGGARYAAAGLVLAALAVGCSAGKATRYGGLPKFLPKTTVSVGRIVDASVAQPKLAIQGDTVSVSLARGHVLAIVVGPAVPPFVAPPPPAVTATFTVTLAQAQGDVPVSIHDFTISDQLGRTDHPQLVTGEAPPATTIPAGGHVTFELTAVLPTGEGVMRWSPNGSSVVSWDFVVEDD